MNFEMTHLAIIALKSDLLHVVQTLRRLGCMQIDSISDSPAISARPLTLDRETLRAEEELSLLLARIDGLLGILAAYRKAEPAAAPADFVLEARSGLEALMPQVQALSSRKEKLQLELGSLPRYEATLRKLLPIIPSAASLPGNVTVGALVNRVHVGVLDSIGHRVLELTGGRAEVVSSDVDLTIRAMLIVFPAEFTSEIENLLGQEDISRLRLPTELGQGPPDVTLAALHKRMAALPADLSQVEEELAGLASQWCGKLLAWRAALQEQVDANRVLSSFGETDMTFVLVGWVPTDQVEKVKSGLEERVAGKIMIQHLPIVPEEAKMVPVILRNPPLAQPFESLVSLLSLPQYGRIDPTRLMAFFLPIFFGLILGDVGYGLLLLALALVLMRKIKAGVAHDILVVLAMGAGWSLLFGVLFGEAFGTLGEHFGMRPLWFDRASSEHVGGLLLMTLAIGAVHISLGLVLGIWEAVKERSRSLLLERGGMLVGLISLFMLVGVLSNYLPQAFRTPAIAGIIIGIAFMGASIGWLGILMGPIEFVGLIGNILSYLRIAAIGLASVYLAKVANDMAGFVGNIIVGALLAVFFHALNLVLGAFSPTIHSLRLHYVEFFRKFYEGGGRAYQPFRSQSGVETHPGS